MSHEYWMGWFGSFMYDLKRNENPFDELNNVQECVDWDSGWYDAQIEEVENEDQILL